MCPVRFRDLLEIIYYGEARRLGEVRGSRER